MGIKFMHISIIIYTKDRPEEIEDILNSIY